MRNPMQRLKGWVSVEAGRNPSPRVIGIQLSRTNDPEPAFAVLFVDLWWFGARFDISNPNATPPVPPSEVHAAFTEIIAGMQQAFKQPGWEKGTLPE